MHIDNLPPTVMPGRWIDERNPSTALVTRDNGNDSDKTPDARARAFCYAGYRPDGEVEAAFSACAQAKSECEGRVQGCRG